MKQTAVEWLIEKLPLIQQEGLRDEIEQAKEMEMQQIMDAVKLGNTYNGWALKHEFKKYYNETFKNETK